MSYPSEDQARARKRCGVLRHKDAHCCPGTRLFLVEDLVPMYIEAHKDCKDYELMPILLKDLCDSYEHTYGLDLLAEVRAIVDK